LSLAWQVKAYVLRQMGKVLDGRVSLQDFVFAKEVRLGSYANPDYAPPSAIVALKAQNDDPRAVPRCVLVVPWTEGGCG
jgi:DNA polymerase zeta